MLLIINFYFELFYSDFSYLYFVLYQYLKINLLDETGQQICNYRCTYESTNSILVKFVS